MARRRQQSQAERAPLINTNLGEEGSSQIPQESYKSHELRTQAHAALGGISDLISRARDIANSRSQVIESQFIQPQTHNEWNRSNLRHSMQHQQALLNEQEMQYQKATMLRNNFDIIDKFANGHAVDNKTVKTAFLELSKHVESNQYSSSSSSHRDKTIPDVVGFIKDNPHIKAFYRSND